MSYYKKYIDEIEERSLQGLNPKPIESKELINEIISQIKDQKSKYRKESINFFIYNVLPGTTGAANIKAYFLKDIIVKKITIKEINRDFEGMFSRIYQHEYDHTLGITFVEKVSKCSFFNVNLFRNE